MTTALDAIQNDIGATLTGQVQLLIYSDRSMFMGALSPGQKEWAGGTIEADFGIVLIDGSAGLDYVHLDARWYGSEDFTSGDATKATASTGSSMTSWLPRIPRRRNLSDAWQQSQTCVSS